MYKTKNYRYFSIIRVDQCPVPVSKKFDFLSDALRQKNTN